MVLDKRKIEIVEEYLPQIAEGFAWYTGDDISSKKLDNAAKKFASGLKPETVLGFYDTSVMSNGKNGYIFTDEKVYYHETLEKPGKFWYEDIEKLVISDFGKKDCDNELQVFFHDESSVTFRDSFVNKTPLCSLLREMSEYVIESQKDVSEHLEYNEKQDFGALAGGIATGAYGQVNKLYDEERFHSRQGHGFAAERANTLYDKLTGHDAQIIGDDNLRNGADRIVDGTLIQSKYCQTGRACINECFDAKGNFRYAIDGKPMQIEVPSDKFDEAVRAMEEKIREGKIPGITDVGEAKNIVRKGWFTYKQAQNIAKFGTIESLAYDAVSGAVTTASSFGVTSVISLATNLWNGEDFDKSLQVATYSGLKVGGTTLATTLISGQLMRAGLNSALVDSSEALVTLMGPKASAVLINGFRSGSNIYGAAAMKSAAKLLRSNVITAGATVIVLSSFDIANIFKGRISGQQLFKNLTNTASTVVGGTGGWIGGAAIGSAILPGVGTIVGGLIGSVAAGSAAGKATNKALGNFIEDDANEMVAIIQSEFETLAKDYLLNQKEAEKSVDKLGDKLDGKLLKDMFASDDREKFARNLLVPIIEDIVSRRSYIPKVSDTQMLTSLKTVLEEIADDFEADEEG